MKRPGLVSHPPANSIGPAVGFRAEAPEAVALSDAIAHWERDGGSVREEPRWGEADELEHGADTC